MFIYEEDMLIRQKELLAEAEHNRLLQSIKPSPGQSRRIYASVLTWMGHLMLNLGTRLTTRFGEQNIIAQP